MYILLGGPKQRATYHEQANLRPMEIWFYQAESPVLPPFFYLLFYKRSPSQPYQLYSPTVDTPTALVTTGESGNDPVGALSFITKSAGEEVARTAVTLLPDQAVDLKRFEPDMESDLLLSTINGLADNPLTREQLEENRLRERVSTSVLTGETAPALTYGVFRDERGEATVSYMLKSVLPDPRLIGPGPDKNLGYDLELRTTVLTPDGKKLVYEQEDRLTGTVTEAQAEVAKKKRFGAEARLPLVPGKYLVVVTLTNNLNHIATRQHAAITVPEAGSQALSLSPLVAYTAPAAVPDPAGKLPFSISKLRFTPRGAQTVELRQGERLPLVFQIWLDPKQQTFAATDKVHLRYVFGAVTAGHENPVEENEEVDASNRDAAGNLLTGHTVDTSGVTPGTYRLVVGAHRDGSQQTAYGSMTVHVLPSTDQPAGWTAYGGVAPDQQAIDDLKRGLSAEALGLDAEAQLLYTKALGEGPAELRALDRLVALLARRGQTQELAALSEQPILAKTAAAPETLLMIAGALSKSGNPKGVVRMLEAQIKLQPPNAELYRTLASACEATGDSSRAKDLRVLAAGVK
jgi:hypothetical protein